MVFDQKKTFCQIIFLIRGFFGRIYGQRFSYYSGGIRELRILTGSIKKKKPNLYTDPNFVVKLTVRNLADRSKISSFSKFCELLVRVRNLSFAHHWEDFCAFIKRILIFKQSLLAFYRIKLELSRM